MTELVLVNARMKVFWIRAALNCSAFDGKSLIQKLPFLIMNLDNWIENMVSMKQVSSVDASIRSTKFMRRFLVSLFTEDLFNAADVKHCLDELKVSQEAVLVQMKGIKRVLLLMRYNTNDAYAVTEFLTNTFNDALACVAYGSE